MESFVSKVARLNSTVWAKLAPSPIHGVGVFAIKDIPQGTEVTDNHRSMMLKPEIYSLTEQEFLMLDKPIQDLILDKNVYREYDMRLNFISPNFECYLQDFTNHSNTPNVNEWYITTRDIKAGEEIVEDFRAFTSQPHHLLKKHFKDYVDYN